MSEEASYKKEKTGWGSVNAELKKHGLPVVEFLSPVKALQTADVVHMELGMSKKMRENLTTLMRDCDRRQALVQELILTNNQLRKDLEKQTAQVQNNEAKVHDLKIMLETSKDRVQDLEFENLNNSSYLQEESEKIRNTKNVLHEKYSRLKVRCTQQQEQIDLLQERLQASHHQEEKRTSRQHEVFHQFKKKAPRMGNDDRVLDIIDSYEKKILALKKEIKSLSLRSSRSMSPAGRRSTSPSIRNVTSPAMRSILYDSDSEATDNYKAILKSYEKQARDGKKNIKRLEDDLEMSRLELQARPEIKDFRAAQQRIKKLEALMRKHRISEGSVKDKNVLPLKYSTQIDDLEYLPVIHTRKYIRLAAEEVGVCDLDDLIPKLQTLARLAEAYPSLEQFSKQVLALVTSDDVPLVPHLKKELPQRKRHAVWCEKTAHYMLTALQYWCQQMQALPDLKQSLNELVEALMPWRERKISGHCDITKLVEVVDSLVYDEQMGEHKGSKGAPSPVVMSGIVEHFQQLFDVPSISGIYPRMNDVYTKLGEAQNVMHTVRDLLGLDEEAKSSEVVEAIGLLCQQHNSATQDQVKEILAVDNLDRLSKKVHEHEEFFPVFRAVTDQLLAVLNVKELDQVVPAVQALKILATMNN